MLSTHPGYLGGCSGHNAVLKRRLLVPSSRPDRVDKRPGMDWVELLVGRNLCQLESVLIGAWRTYLFVKVEVYRTVFMAKSYLGNFVQIILCRGWLLINPLSIYPRKKKCWRLRRKSLTCDPMSIQPLRPLSRFSPGQRKADALVQSEANHLSFSSFAL